jgi:transcriptional regulator with XRE-family HTH domain
MAVSTISSRIKMVRQKLGKTQKEFGQYIFLSHSFYANMERGVRKPNERICELICHKYGVNKAWLNTGDGDMFLKSPPDIEVEQLVDLIKGLDPLFKEYIIQQIKQFANLHKKNKEGQNSHKGNNPKKKKKNAPGTQ